jgi:alpha-galactosidase
VVLGIAAVFLTAQQDISGVWVLKVPRGDETFRKTWYELKQDGRNVAIVQLSDRTPEMQQQAGAGGTGRGAQTPITGTFIDGKLHFEIAGRGFRQGAAATAAPAPTVYEGTLVNGKFALTITGGRGGSPSAATLERSTREASYPVRLPLPPLHQVKGVTLAKTPPMGWNSWNLFANRIDDNTVREMADAMVTSGMKKAGYIYVNIDDTWEGENRDANGNMTTNSKFPNMKALADYVHSKGLKIGIYSSPGPTTCQNYEGTYGHEDQDAKTFAAWGIDYIKYDWCGASRIYNDEDMRALYQKFGDALAKAGRPIIYSLCQYGRAKVWEWGPLVGGSLWRTTGDIGDRWQSMENIGFGPSVPSGIPRQPGTDQQPGVAQQRGGQQSPNLTQLDIAQYSKAGAWNDPDMLEIGNGGMTNDEYKTHFALWCMLRAPLLAGNDIRKMTQETKDILLNTEVIAIDQDTLAAPPKLALREGRVDVLTRPLRDKSTAVAIFNRGDEAVSFKLNWSAIGLKGKLSGRDLYKHATADLSGDTFTADIPRHGVVILKVTSR